MTLNDPTTCRFVNADGYVSTGQGLLGNNMFAYCGNNPVNRWDDEGNLWDGIGKAVAKLASSGSVEKFAKDMEEDKKNFDINNRSEKKVLESHYISAYKGVFVIRTDMDRSGSFGMIFLARAANKDDYPEDVVRHEYGHTKQLAALGPVKYGLYIGLPSILNPLKNEEYYQVPWEVTADIFGGVQSRHPTQEQIVDGLLYLLFVDALG